jgi:hypothetical protein
MTKQQETPLYHELEDTDTLPSPKPEATDLLPSPEPARRTKQERYIIGVQNPKDPSCYKHEAEYKTYQDAQNAAIVLAYDLGQQVAIIDREAWSCPIVEKMDPPGKPKQTEKLAVLPVITRKSRAKSNC